MYRAPGTYEVPLGQVLPQLASRIINAPSFARDISKMLSSMGSGNRRLSNVGLEDIIAIEGSGSMPNDSGPYRAFMHLFTRFAAGIGVACPVPAIIGYRSTAELTLEECVDAMISKVLPDPASIDLGAKEYMTLDTIRAVFPMYVREVAAVTHLRKLYIQRLRLYAGHVGYKIAMRAPISAAERSFFLMMCDPTDPRSWSADFIASGANNDPGANIAPVDAVNRATEEAFALLTSVTEAGPFTRFGVMQSNQNIEHMIYWFGPQQSSLTYTVGHLFKFGIFDELRPVEVYATLPWTPEDQVAAARERVMNVAHREIGAMMHTAVMAASPSDVSPMPTWDHQDVQIELKLNQESITPTGFSYFSAWRKRHVSVEHNESPLSFMHDLALANARYGEGVTSGKDVTSWDLLDLEESRSYLGGQAPVALPVSNFVESIYVPIGARRVIMKSVDMTRFYTSLGTTVFYPPFREFVTAPMSWLYFEDKAAEDYICAKLNLTWEEKQQSLRTIRISHNYARLEQLLSTPQLPISRLALERLCAAMVGG